MFRFFPYWPLFLVLSGLMLVAAWVYVGLTNPTYEVTTTLLIKDEKKGVEDSHMLESFNIYTSKKIVENEIEVIKSKALIRETVKRLNLCSSIAEDDFFTDRPAYTSSPVMVEVKNIDSLISADRLKLYYDKLHGIATLEGEDFPLNRWVKSYYGLIRFVPNPYFAREAAGALYVSFHDPRLVVDGISSSLNVLASNKLTTVITLMLRDPVPIRGENILNTLVDAYRKAGTADKRNLAQNTMNFVDERIKLVEHELDSVEKSIQRYKSSRGIVDLSEQGKVFLKNVGDNDQRLSELSMQVAVLDRVQAYIVKKDSTSRIIPSTLGIRDDNLVRMIQRLYEVELDYARQRRTSTSTNPLLMQLQEEIQNIRGRILENVKTQRASLLTQRGNLNSTNSRYASVLGTLPQQERELLEAQRQQAIKSDVYTFLLQKREETALTQTANVSDSLVVDAAEATLFPVAPKKMLIYALALLGGFALSAAWVVWKELLNKAILFRSEIESQTSIPIVAEILDSGSRDYIVVDNLKNPVGTEQFMQMRASIGLYGSSAMKVVAVTSSIAGEGKTFVSTNFAISLAAANKRVLLVDLDFRNPRLSNLFKAAHGIGAAEVLLENAELNKAIRATQRPNLYLMGVGQKRAGGTTTLMDGNLDTMFTQLRAKFDYIVVDMPPIKPLVDSFVVSKLCDITLFVVRHGKTPKRLDTLKGTRSISQLKNVGIVFNGIKQRGLLTRAGSYGYGYGYEYGETYGPGSPTHKRGLRRLFGQ